MTELPETLPEGMTRGRGAASNRAGRFETLTQTRIDDGWTADAPEVQRTDVSCEHARSMITYNRSPDLPFDRSINPYRGCEHGCIYCFARPSHAYLGLSPGLDFETKLIARPNAAEVLAAELAKPGYKVAPIAIGTNTDPYQPIEKKMGLARECLDVLARARHPVAIVTKGSLIERDIDILARMAKQGLVRVGISITTLDPVLARKMEPRCPAPARRLETIRRLAAACIPVRVMASPMVPALTDHELEAILEAGAIAGASTASWIMLRLPREVSQLWQEWLQTHFPDRTERIMGHLRGMHGGKDYDARWGHRMRGQGPYAEMIAQRFDRAVRAVGLETHAPRLPCHLFRPPTARSAQLSLFEDG
ncbi:PA0069 family radical SAM protein [Primorskyibacter sp. S187A]|uniref:PA0069 family radical SAM protein n=1 Tax=Primorskyibacter sp. S187A TaxID=3415130 RepID=UPI003C7B4E6D